MAPRWVTHISCHYKNTIEGTGENKTNEQTRTKRLGLTQDQKGSMQHYISDSIYGLTLAWITSEHSTKQLECRHLDSIFFHWSGPHLLRLVSPLRCPVSTASVRVPSPILCQLLSRQLFANSLLASRYLTPRFQVRKPFIWFRAKTDKGIVCLAGHLYSVTKRQPKNQERKLEPPAKKAKI